MKPAPHRHARFLVLPWVQSHNLVSRILATASCALRGDWQRHYGYAPVMLKAFVEAGRFRGTAYQAANWHYLGQTKGHGKLDVRHQAKLPKKAVWIYPLSQATTALSVHLQYPRANLQAGFPYGSTEYLLWPNKTSVLKTPP